MLLFFKCVISILTISGNNVLLFLLQIWLLLLLFVLIFFIFVLIFVIIIFHIFYYFLTTTIRASFISLLLCYKYFTISKKKYVNFTLFHYAISIFIISSYSVWFNESFLFSLHSRLFFLLFNYRYVYSDYLIIIVVLFYIMIKFKLNINYEVIIIMTNFS